VTTGVRSGQIGYCIGSSSLYHYTTTVEQTTELLKAIQRMLHEMKAGMKFNLKEMREEITARIEARTDVNNEKFDPTQSTLVSQMDMHQALLKQK
jgi:cob(I)alamin adenosyltransferase